MKSLLAESIRDFRLPRYAEIPTVGLYLEQTTKYINGYLAPLGCMELTASMVSNYVKKGLIPAPVRKQYEPEQIAYLFFIAIAKNLMTIEDIYLMIQVQRSSYPLDVAYDYVCAEMENMLHYCFGLKDQIAEIGVTQSQEKHLLRNMLVAAANTIYLHCYCAQLRKDGWPKSK